MEIWKWVSGVIIEDDNETSAFQEHSVIRFLWILLPDFSPHIFFDFVARFVSPHISLDFVDRFSFTSYFFGFCCQICFTSYCAEVPFPRQGTRKACSPKNHYQFFFFPDLTSSSFFKKRSWRSASRECENL